MSEAINKMNVKQMLREQLDNAVYQYIQGMGTDADNVDYSELDEWLEEVTGVVNPLEDN